MSIKIITHDGRFHADEVSGVALLLHLYNISEIIRTRDEEILEKGKNDTNTIVLDVGKEYDVLSNNYDHHQKSFSETFSNDYTIPLSSCGLIWKHFGKDIIRKLVEKDLTHDMTEKIYQIMYKKVFLSIDANDNGIKSIKSSSKVEYNFFYTVTLDEIVGSFNTPGNDNDLDQFNKAVSICSQYFENKIKQVFKSVSDYEKDLPYFTEVYKKYHELGYLYLDDDSVYYGSYINDFDKENEVLYFISKKNDQNYKIYTRRINPGSFDIVAPIIPENDARELVGDDLIFVHKAHFIGGCKTLESAETIVSESIKRYEESRHIVVNFNAGITINHEFVSNMIIITSAVFIGLTAWYLTN